MDRHNKNIIKFKRLAKRTDTVAEKDVENYLKMQFETKLGGTAYKFTSPGRRFVPDRLLVCPPGIVCFVEVKKQGKKPNVGQMREIDKLTNYGLIVFVIDSKAKVDELITHLLGQQTLLMGK